MVQLLLRIAKDRKLWKSMTAHILTGYKEGEKEKEKILFIFFYTE